MQDDQWTNAISAAGEIVDEAKAARDHLEAALKHADAGHEQARTHLQELWRARRLGLAADEAHPAEDAPTDEPHGQGGEVANSGGGVGGSGLCHGHRGTPAILAYLPPESNDAAADPNIKVPELGELRKHLQDIEDTVVHLTEACEQARLLCFALDEEMARRNS
ncbi:uncharacterized protein EHS24_002211 [Apiotrichum porosum]|uniref:Uncharacterized protein n=1 Tax=Apiotrichum porosum TaxID=105984 RepID=A0A427XI27_9TREE|nr:uncharacterized protein EHS24_002211 [Apiotrichum porosum]RSH78486.1 hypothetical protein EHS24_002211 [Apiotrichum porosum]